jgi:glycosyltransferase involved in cell wall biosynthesis
MPFIRERVPAAKLRIIGDSPPPAVQQLAGPGIEVLGYVPDLQVHLLRNRISVAPLRYGGGIKGKIGEAMSAGLPVVTTSVGTEGFGLSAGEHALVAETPEAFAAAVVNLLQDRAFYDRIRRAGWEFIAQRFSPEVVKANLLRFFAEVAAAPRKAPSAKERLKMTLPYPVVQLIRRIW